MSLTGLPQKDPHPFRGKFRGKAGWLPGALTLGNLLAGFASILVAMDDKFWQAGLLIFVAFVLDGVDGRVARLVGGESGFGEQLDSLCDAVSFAVAPSLLAFMIGVGDLGRFGWAACFIFTACGIIRLARFNAGLTDDKDFIGLPIPTAAAAAAVPVLLTQGEPLPDIVKPIHAVVIVVVGLMMVSRVRYPAFKKLRFPANPYLVLVVWAVLLAGLLAMHEWVIPALIVGYMLVPVYEYLKGRGVTEAVEGAIAADDDL